MEMKKLLDYMQNHTEEFLSLLKETTLIETPTEGDKNDLAACRDCFAHMFSLLGFNSRVVPSGDARYGDHLLMEYGDGGQPLLIIGHYDTVYHKGSFSKDIWQIEGNRLIGPGVLDMKGGIVLTYMAIKALQSLDLLPAGKIAFFLSSDEEAGSHASRMHFETWARKSKAAFVVESSVGVEGDYIGGLKSGRFGRSTYTFAAQGKSAHSGLEPECAESALIELARQAVALEGLSDYGDLNKETDNTSVVTIGCTSMHSGDAGWPTIPGGGELSIDARFSTAELMAEYDKILREPKPFNPNVQIDVSGGIEKPPFDSGLPGNKALQERAVRIGKELGIEMAPRIVRSGSDGNFASATGCPTLDGMGVTGNYAHQPGKEYLRLDHIPFRGAFLAGMIAEVLNAR